MVAHQFESLKRRTINLSIIVSQVLTHLTSVYGSKPKRREAEYELTCKVYISAALRQRNHMQTLYIKIHKQPKLDHEFVSFCSGEFGPFRFRSCTMCHAFQKSTRTAMDGAANAAMEGSTVLRGFQCYPRIHGLCQFLFTLQPARSMQFELHISFK